MAHTLQATAGPHEKSAVTPVGWATAGTVSEVVAFRAPFKLTITAVRLLADAAVTANATNFATIEVRNKGAAGSGTVVMASHAFDTVTTDDVAAFDEKALVLSATAANLDAAEGDVIAIRKTVGGTGLAVAGAVVVEYRSS